MSELIKRTYRIRKEQDKVVKSKKGGESEYIRQLIDSDNLKLARVARGLKVK